MTFDKLVNLILEENQNDFYFDQTKDPLDFTLEQKVFHVNKVKMFWGYRKQMNKPPIGFVVPKWKPVSPDYIKLENYMEKVREEINPDAVSRLNCRFVCPIKRGWCRCDSYHNDVAIVEVTGKIYIGDIDLYSRIADTYKGYQTGRGREGLLEDIEMYWDSKRYSTNPEVLVDGEVVVVGYACKDQD